MVRSPPQLEGHGGQATGGEGGGGEGGGGDGGGGDGGGEGGGEGGGGIGRLHTLYPLCATVSEHDVAVLSIR